MVSLHGLDESLGFRVQGLGERVQGLGLVLQGVLFKGPNNSYYVPMVVIVVERGKDLSDSFPK